VRLLADPQATPLIRPSQGIHLVFDRSFLPGDSAIMVPHTRDKRVMFAIPWLGHTLVGTTDTPVSEVTAEPVAQDQEVEFILETAGLYLAKTPTRSDVQSVFAGIRPLVGGDGANTAALSRDHAIHIDQSGLLSIAGGKWTTYRRMAEDGVNQAATLGRLPERACVTQELKIHAYEEVPRNLDAEIVRAAREEMARTVEDCLARRTRALFLNARQAVAQAPRVAAILAEELGRDDAWQQDQVRLFTDLAGNYMLT